MKRPPIKPLKSNDKLAAGIKVRTTKSGTPHSIVFYVRSTEDYAGTMRLVLYLVKQKYVYKLRLDNPESGSENGFVTFASDVAGCKSYDELFLVLKRHGFPEDLP